jgi:hypothetical protein
VNPAFLSGESLCDDIAGWSNGCRRWNRQPDAFCIVSAWSHLTSHHNKLKKICSNVVNLEKKYWTGGVDVEVYSRLAGLLVSVLINII